MKARDRVAVTAPRSRWPRWTTPKPCGRPTSAARGIELTPAGVGATEVERRVLTDAQVRDIGRAEIAEREHAAREYDRNGRADRAGLLRAEAGTLSGLLV
jgi:hypothetical protein